MFAISVHFSERFLTENQNFKERASLDPEATDLFLRRLRETGISESVYLMAGDCCEIYGVGRSSRATKAFARFTGIDVSTLRENLLVYENHAAARHLFRLACGMEVVDTGSVGILRCLRGAYFYSKERGFCGHELDAHFQAALRTAKKIHAVENNIDTPVSLASIVAEKIHTFHEDKKYVLMIGSGGELGKQIRRLLLSYGDCQIYTTVRQKHAGREDGVLVISYESRYDFFDRVDVILSATKSPHFTITKRRLLEAGLRMGGKKLYIDLSRPRDIDDTIRSLPDTEFCIIDDFEKIVEKRGAAAEKEGRTAEEMVEKAIDDLEKDLIFNAFLPEMRSLASRHTGGLENFLYSYEKAASAQELSDFIEVLKKIQR